MNLLRTRATARTALGCLGSIALAGCAVAGSAPTEESASSREALDAPTSYVYLRCNATSWDTNDASRLTEGSTPGLLELSFDVKEPWMLAAGADCVFTETPVKNGWGDWAKFYGSYDWMVNAPAGGIIKERTKETTEQQLDFKVRFPSVGRYRARVDWAHKIFSIVADGAPRSGDVTWAWPGQLAMDARGDLFSTPGYAAQTFALLDHATGRPVWSRDVAASSSPVDMACSNGADVITPFDHAIQAIDVATGRTKWTNDLGGALAPQTSYVTLRCGDPNVVYALYGDGSNTIAAVRRSDGATLWTYQAKSFVSIQGFTATRVFAYASNELVALDAASGVERWSYASADAFYPEVVQGGDAVLVQAKGTVTRLDAEGGQAVWSRTFPGDYAWASFDGGVLTVNGTTQVDRVDPRDGTIRWSHAYTAPYGSSQVLSNGATLLREGNDVTLVDAATGAPQWTRAFGAYVPAFEDAQARLYLLVDKGTLSRVDPATGRDVWTLAYAFPGLAPAEHPWDARGFVRVVTSDAGAAYVVYDGNGYYKAPPQGLLAVDAATGAVRWDHWVGAGVDVVGQDDRRLFLNVGYYYSPTRPSAILK